MHFSHWQAFLHWQAGFVDEQQPDILIFDIIGVLFVELDFRNLMIKKWEIAGGEYPYISRVEIILPGA